MRRHVMCPHVMSCHLLCPAMGWNVMSLRCHWLWGHVVWFEVVLWRCGDSKYYSVLLFATKYSSCATLHYKVLLHYYSVLQSTTPPVLLCTTIYYSMTTPVPLCTTKYYSCAAPLLLCSSYKVLLCTTPVLLCTTKCYSVLQHTAPVLLCTTGYYSSTSLYYKVLLLSALYYSSITLYRKVTLIIDPPHIRNVIYNGRSNRCHLPLHQVPWIALRGATLVTLHHPPPSLHTAPATQNITPKSKRHLLKTDETSFTLRGRFENIPNMIRPWTRHFAPARLPRLVFTLRRRILHWNLQHFGLRRSTQISPNAAPDITCCACHEKWHCNIAKCCAGPGGKNDSHDSWLILLRQNELFLDWTVTEQLLYQTVTWLICYLTGLLLNCYLPEPLLY